MKISPEIRMMKLNFLELDARLKKFGRTLCRFHRNRTDQTHGMQCNHPSMGYGGMNRNTDCELVNCPRVLYGDEGKGV